MKLTIRPATPEMFAELRTWRYEPPYDFYDGDAEPVRNPERWYEARDEAGALVGNFYFEEKGDALEIGLGLRPDLTGRGLGLDFLVAGGQHDDGDTREGAHGFDDGLAIAIG